MEEVKCPCCKNMVEGFKRITKVYLVKVKGLWLEDPDSTTIEVRCPYCNTELGEDDLHILGIPSELVE